MTSTISMYEEANKTISFTKVNGVQMVIKTIPFSSTALNELAILQRLQDHPYIINLLAFAITQTGIKMYFPLISETLLDRVQKAERGLPLRLVHSIFTQIISGLSYIHRQNIVHQDLKLENVLIDEDNHIYIIDFGFSRSYKPGIQGFKHNYGSLHYAAPEIWLLKKCEGPEVDLWSLGVCLFLMLTSYFPFGGDNPREVWLSVQEGLQRTPKRIRTNSLLCELVQSLLCFSSESRATLPKVLLHPWVRNCPHSS